VWNSFKDALQCAKMCHFQTKKYHLQVRLRLKFQKFSRRQPRIQWRTVERGDPVPHPSDHGPPLYTALSPNISQVYLHDDDLTLRSLRASRGPVTNIAWYTTVGRRCRRVVRPWSTTTSEVPSSMSAPTRFTAACRRRLSAGSRSVDLSPTVESIR